MIYCDLGCEEDQRVGIMRLVGTTLAVQYRTGEAHCQFRGIYVSLKPIYHSILMFVSNDMTIPRIEAFPGMTISSRQV